MNEGILSGNDSTNLFEFFHVQSVIADLEIVLMNQLSYFIARQLDADHFKSLAQLFDIQEAISVNIDLKHWKQINFYKKKSEYQNQKY